MSTLQALIFDVDGTLADTEDVHRQAFNQAFAEAGLDWHWDRVRYTHLLETSGGQERIARACREAQPSTDPAVLQAQSALVQSLHQRKTALYTQWVAAGAVCLRPGVAALIDAALADGLRLAIATTTTPANIGALLRGPLGSGWARLFEVIEDADTAPLKKPHPQVYLQAMRRLNLPAHACLALEDSANGLQAASAAGLATLITPTAYTAQHAFDGAMRVRPDLSGVRLPELRAWHAAAPAHP